ncbi:co-chaperone GrpE [Coccidioides immitis RS]|uniref:GrpE protein homolog n=4 Tax=Coccidioides immitis TaxID=5501 RepID=J3KEX2_COCIM|nr:co-chaperone GrpE [Coccidioides immitis RS]KMP05314.1 grpE [Coccidioides immitis RMSCC 2394]KMU77842.1 grpE [Coccidioides immitis RMSCC 3703]KMU85776.1 grpE [Coccidioides immitis H538.4]TPX21675.1 Mitochondrial matrix cochaperone [Coccidioides immitis]EAS34091.3 co-chaperone GrpE [Coccidioides immitis RS]
MFRRALIRQSQAARSAFTTRSISSSPLSRKQPLLQTFTQFGKPLPSRVCQRFNSTESQQKNAENASADGKNGEQKPSESQLSEAEATLRKEVEKQEREIIDLKDKYLRSVADFRNLQERTKRDVDAARSFAIQRFGADLIESIDNFERALEAVPSEKLNNGENKDLADLYDGLKMTEKVIMNTLKKHGLERFDPSELVEGKPQKFDPKLHEATFMAPAPGKEDGDILHVQTKGFILNGRVLRAAKVGVVKNA